MAARHQESQLALLLKQMQHKDANLRRKGLAAYTQHLKRRAPQSERWMDRALLPLHTYAGTLEAHNYKDPVETFNFVQCIGELRMDSGFEHQLNDDQRRGMDNLIWRVADNPAVKTFLKNEVKSLMFTVVSHDISTHIADGKHQVSALKKLGSADEYSAQRMLYNQYAPKA